MPRPLTLLPGPSGAKKKGGGLSPGEGRLSRKEGFQGGGEGTA